MRNDVTRVAVPIQTRSQRAEIGTAEKIGNQQSVLGDGQVVGAADIEHEPVCNRMYQGEQIRAATSPTQTYSRRCSILESDG